MLERDPDAPVLLVVGAVPLAETFAPLVDEPAVPYAFACRLGSAGSGPGIELSLAESSQLPPRPPGLCVGCPERPKGPLHVPPAHGKARGPAHLFRHLDQRFLVHAHPLSGRFHGPRPI